MLGEEITTVLKMAAEKEDEARNLYLGLQKKIKNKAAKQLLGELAAAEAKHKKFLESASAEALLAEVMPEVKDLGISEYLVEPAITEEMSLQDVLVLAMKREERSVELYTSIAEKLSPKKYKPLFLNMANEERKHKARIEKLYDDKIYEEN